MRNKFLLLCMLVFSINFLFAHETPDIIMFNSQKNIGTSSADDVILLSSKLNSQRKSDHIIADQTSIVNLMDSIRNWKWDTLSETFLDQGRNVLLYDSNNNLSYVTYENHDSIQWNYTMRYYFVSDQNNNRINTLAQIMDSLTWVDQWRETRSYDASNNLTSTFAEIYDSISWVNSSQVSYTYDANNNLTDSYVQIWSNGVWDNYSLRSIGYDSNDDRISDTTFNWSGTAWVNSTLINATYDSNHNKLTETNLRWVGSSWKNEKRYTYVYVNDDKISELREVWDNSAWKNSSLFEFSYDSNHNYLEMIYRPWNDSMSTWIDGTNFHYTYYPDNNMQSAIAEYWNSTDSVFIRRDSTYYYYHSAPVAVNDIDALDENVNLFPNPSNGELYFTGLPDKPVDVVVTDISGVSVKSELFISGRGGAITVRDLLPGAYFVNLKFKDRVIIKMFVKN